MAIKKQVAMSSDLDSHISADWKVVHGIWNNIRPLIAPDLHCFVYSASDLISPTSNGYTTVPFDTVVSDPSSMFNAPTHLATIPTAGIYLLTTGVQISNAIGGNRGIIIEVLLNGAPAQYLDENNAQPTGTIVNYGNSILLSLTVTNTIGVTFYLIGVTGANMKILGGVNMTWMRLALFHL